jgi:hypothetical protein
MKEVELVIVEFMAEEFILGAMIGGKMSSGW